MSIESILERIAVALERNAFEPSTTESSTEAPPPAQPVLTSAQLPAQAPPTGSRGRGRPRAPAATQTLPSPVLAAPAAAASAPAAAQAAPAGGGGSSTLLKDVTEKVLALANDFSREEAIAILKARRGVTRCSDLLPEELAGVLADATAAYDRSTSLADTAAANALI